MMNGILWFSTRLHTFRPSFVGLFQEFDMMIKWMMAEFSLAASVWGSYSTVHTGFLSHCHLTKMDPLFMLPVTPVLCRLRKSQNICCEKAHNSLISPTKRFHDSQSQGTCELPACPDVHKPQVEIKVMLLFCFVFGLQVKSRGSRCISGLQGWRRWWCEWNCFCPPSELLMLHIVSA